MPIAHSSLIITYLLMFMVLSIHLQMQLDDSILKTIETSSKPELKEARDLVQRIRRRDLYQVPWNINKNRRQWILKFLLCKETNQPLGLNLVHVLTVLSDFQFCNEFSVPKEEIDYFKCITPQDIICSQVQKSLSYATWMSATTWYPDSTFSIRKRVGLHWEKMISQWAMLRLTWLVEETTLWKGTL